MTDVDLEKAMNDPANVFATPEAVADHAGLSDAQKAEILRRWEYDAAEMAVAGEEGMPVVDGDLLHRLLACLDRVAGGFDVEHTGPTKQQGLPRAKDIAPRS